jgi:hypothetical protein
MSCHTSFCPKNENTHLRLNKRLQLTKDEATVKMTRTFIFINDSHFHDSVLYFITEI